MIDFQGASRGFEEIFYEQFVLEDKSHMCRVQYQKARHEKDYHNPFVAMKEELANLVQSFNVNRCQEISCEVLDPLSRAMIACPRLSTVQFLNYGLPEYRLRESFENCLQQALA